MLQPTWVGARLESRCCCRSRGRSRERSGGRGRGRGRRRGPLRLTPALEPGPRPDLRHHPRLWQRVLQLRPQPDQRQHEQLPSPPPWPTHQQFGAVIHPVGNVGGVLPPDDGGSWQPKGCKCTANCRTRFLCSLRFVLLCFNWHAPCMARTTAKPQLRMHARFSSLRSNFHAFALHWSALRLGSTFSQQHTHAAHELETRLFRGSLDGFRGLCCACGSA